MFYRYISENLCNYINSGEIEAGNTDFDYAKMSDEEAREGLVEEKGFFTTAQERIQLVTQYILEHFDQKTYRGDKTYIYNRLMNVKEVASAKRDDEVEEIKEKQRISGFNSIFAVSSVPMAKLYYQEFKKQMKKNPMEFYMKKIQKIPQHWISHPEIFWKMPSRIIMKCFIRITIPQVINSRIITKMYLFA